MPDTEYLASLQILIAKIDALAISAERREELLMKINGYVREHGELLSTHVEWIRTHDRRHKRLERDMHTLSNRIWVLSGGTGVLATVATILQFLNL